MTFFSTASALLGLLGFILSCINLKHWYDERMVVLYFNVIASDHEAVLLISNLGKVPALVTRIAVRESDGEWEGRELHVLVNPNTPPHRCLVPWGVFRQWHLTIDVEFKLFYISNRGAELEGEAQGFNMIGAYGDVARVTRGFDYPRTFSCSKCSEQFNMAVDGLNKADEVAARRKKFERDLKKSCPVHISKWSLKAYKKKP